MRALFLGRFQPFHCGHLRVIRDVANKAEYVVIVIGSAQHSHLPDNPFTAGERYAMISKTLKEEGIENHHIVTLEDLNRYSLWVAHVESHSPEFDVVYAHNPLSVRLFSEAGYKVIKLELYKPEVYSGTEIRRRMVEGEEWEDLVPKRVVEIIKNIDGPKRVRDIAK